MVYVQWEEGKALLRVSTGYPAAGAGGGAALFPLATPLLLFLVGRPVPDIS